MTEEVKLIGMWASPFNCRVEIALKLKGIQYKYIEEDLSNKSALLLKYNPVHKKVPVFVHNGKSIAESLVILEYIDETWKDNPLLPKDPYDKTIARFWAKFVDEKILQTATKIRMAKGEELEQLHQEFKENMQWLENELKGKDFFGGDKIGHVDIVAFAIAHWFQVMCQDVLQSEFISEEKFPVLHKWLEKIREIDVIKECLPPRDKHVAFMKARFEAMKSASK